MSRLLKTFAVGVAMFGLSGIARAAIYTDVDVIGLPLIGKYLSTGESHDGTFNITGPGLGKGYVPGGSEVITDATIIFTFLDDLYDPRGAREESVAINVNGDLFNNVSTILFWGNLTGSVSILSNSGVLDYLVTVNTGDIRLTSATLVANSAESSRVPDSTSTISLLGLGLLALGMARRRLSHS